MTPATAGGLAIDWGVRPYDEVHAWQEALVEKRAAGEIPNLLLTGQHPAVVTLGRKSKGDAPAVKGSVEKPSPPRAALLRQQGPLWNTGLFAWGVARFLGEAAAYANELAAGWSALSGGDAPRFFSAVKPVAVDVAVLERTKRLAVVRGTFPWDDIGSWDALLRIRRPDARGNVVVGRVTLGDDVRDCVIWAEDEHIAVTGLEDTVVVRANGHTLVMPTGHANQLKALVQRL